jgi:hypothetical protein
MYDEQHKLDVAQPEPWGLGQPSALL